MSESPFEDQDLPFMDGDNLQKPSEGDIVVLKNLGDTISDGAMDKGRVIAVYNSLAEDWGSDGESAWTQHDVNGLAGLKGHWYAIIENVEYEGETQSVASYEVERVIAEHEAQ